ncbi:MAG: MgtC/SapB family protein [Planctomycetota bacterium]|nr:MgtC/SapB family protein [Planctomycetota bacterium]
MLASLTSLFLLHDVPEPWSAILRLLASAVLGGLIGAEREHHGRSAGLRTQLLVALGSCLAMIVSLHFATVYGQPTSESTLRVDPGRVAYGVMGGIGFLGAGAIVYYGTGIRGLTTAAALWCNAAIGLACGFGMLDVAAAATAIVVFVLMALAGFDRFITTEWYRSIAITTTFAGKSRALELGDLLQARGFKVLSTDLAQNRTDGVETVTFHVSLSSRGRPKDIPTRLDDIPDVLNLSIK